MNEFIKFVASLFGVDYKSLKPDTSYGSLERWDSIMHLRLVMEIEENYEIEIPIDDVPNLKTISDFYKYISK